MGVGGMIGGGFNGGVIEVGLVKASGAPCSRVDILSWLDDCPLFFLLVVPFGVR